MTTNSLHYLFLFLKKKLHQILQVNKSLLKNQITLYPDFVQIFEKNFAQYHHKKWALTFCNGTSAIEASLFALGLKAGDEVLVPSCTFHASIDPIINLGAQPIFVDVDPNNYSICPKDLEKKITDKTRAVMVVHLFGIPAPMNEIVAICQKKNIEIIEDVSHSHGAMVGNKYCGTFGRIGAFSLQGAKAVAAGEGGITITDSEEDFLKMSFYGHFNRHGDQFSKINLSSFQHVGLGFKRRMAPLGAHLAQIDLDQLNKVNHIMQKVTHWIDKEFESIPGVLIPKLTSDMRRGGFYCGYPFRVKDPNLKDTLIEELNKISIETSDYPFQFHHQLSCYDLEKRQRWLAGQNQDLDHIKRNSMSLPNTEAIKDSLILIRRKYLITLSQNKIKQIAKVVRQITSDSQSPNQSTSQSRDAI